MVVYAPLDLVVNGAQRQRIFHVAEGVFGAEFRPEIKTRNLVNVYSRENLCAKLNAPDATPGQTRLRSYLAPLASVSIFVPAPGFSQAPASLF